MAKRYIYCVTIALFSLLLVELTAWAGWIRMVENVYYDMWHCFSGRRQAPQHTVLVLVDDETLLQHPEKPLTFWGPEFAQVIERLRRARVSLAGLDFLFSVSAESLIAELNLADTELSRKYDVPLRAQLASGQVILPGIALFDENGACRPLIPLPEFYFSLPHQEADVGLTNLYLDADGFCRRYQSAMSGYGCAPSLSFAALLAVRFLGLDPESPIWTMNGHQVANRSVPSPPIGFTGPPGTIPRISMNRLLEPASDQDDLTALLRGKIAIIATDFSGSQDMHPTPYARSFPGWEGSMMIGAEVQANILETMLSGRYPRPVPGMVRSAGLLVLFLAAAFLFFRHSILKSVGLGLFGGLAAGALGYALFRTNHVIPVAGAQLGLVFCFLGSLGLRLTGEERKRGYLQRMFGRYVSEDMVEQLLASGADPDLGGETAQVTVLFSDIRNFTTISEQLKPAEVVEMLNYHLGKMSDIILDQGGTVDKFIGDAIMGLFGAPARQPDHARRALAAAVAMAAQAADVRAWMKQRFSGMDLPEFRIGIGLHTGEAVIGHIGSNRRTEYTAIGDTVNTASRLEGLSKELKWTIVASTAVIDAGGRDVQTGDRGTVQVKGRDQAVSVVEVIGISDQG